MFINKIIQLLRLYKFCAVDNFLNNTCLSTIEDINILKMEMVIQTRGVSAPLYFKFNEIINDEGIINSVSSKQASIIGYCYGMYYFDVLKTNDYQHGFFYCFKTNPLKKYTIQGLDRRKNIIYTDQTSGAIYNQPPIQIMLDENLINKFPPLQSCYIGILSGIFKSKLHRNSTLNTSPNLKLV